MKKLIVAILISTFAMASLPDGEFQGLNAQYKSPVGTASADYLNIDGFGNYRNPTLSVENKDGLLSFGFDGKEFQIDLTLFAVRDADYINVDDMNFVNNKRKIKLDFYGLNASSIGYSTDIRRGSANCKRTKTYTDATQDLVLNCLSNSELSVHSFSFLSETNSFKSLVEDGVETSEIILNNIQLDISKGYVEGSFSSNLSFGFDVSFNGKIDYDVASELVVVRVDDVRAGFFSVRSKLFTELAANAPDNMLVDEPYIYIELK